MSPDKLVYMANQIATFFSSQPGDDQADSVALHMRDFWEPRMRTQLLEIADSGSGDTGLSPIARAAVERLRATAA